MLDNIKDNVTIKPDGCWEWQKSCSSSGYGQARYKGKLWSAHRLAYTGGEELPPNIVVRHKCHNPKCCNPEHLVSGTQKDNWLDSKSKHLQAHKKRRKNWIILGTNYSTCREAGKETNICTATIQKYTDKTTRIFDVEAYRASCTIANVTPRI